MWEQASACQKNNQLDAQSLLKTLIVVGSFFDIYELHGENNIKGLCLF
jgi:hypothetical protein